MALALRGWRCGPSRRDVRFGSRLSQRTVSILRIKTVLYPATFAK
jgi:hypothetical protein